MGAAGHLALPGGPCEEETLHPLYTPDPRLRPAIFDRDVSTHTVLAMRGGDPREFGVLYRTFQRAEVRTWAYDSGQMAALVAWVRVHPWALDRVVSGDVAVLDELDPFTLHMGPVVVVCELWTLTPGVVYRLGRELARLPGAEWLVGRRGPRWRAHRIGRQDGTDFRPGADDPERDREPAEHARPGDEWDAGRPGDAERL